MTDPLHVRLSRAVEQMAKDKASGHGCVEFWRLEIDRILDEMAQVKPSDAESSDGGNGKETP